VSAFQDIAGFLRGPRFSAGRWYDAFLEWADRTYLPCSYDIVWDNKGRVLSGFRRAEPRENANTSTNEEKDSIYGQRGYLTAPATRWNSDGVARLRTCLAALTCVSAETFMGFCDCCYFTAVSIKNDHRAQRRSVLVQVSTYSITYLTHVHLDIYGVGNLGASGERLVLMITWKRPHNFISARAVRLGASGERLVVMKTVSPTIS